MFESFVEKSQKNGPLAENCQTERPRGLGRKTREEIGKGNEMIALRFQTGGDIRHPPSSLRGLCLKVYDWEITVLNEPWSQNVEFMLTPLY